MIPGSAQITHQHSSDYKRNTGPLFTNGIKPNTTLISRRMIRLCLVVVISSNRRKRRSRYCVRLWIVGMHGRSLVRHVLPSSSTKFLLTISYLAGSNSTRTSNILYEIIPYRIRARFGQVNSRPGRSSRSSRSQQSD